VFARPHSTYISNDTKLITHHLSLILTFYAVAFSVSTFVITMSYHYRFYAFGSNGEGQLGLGYLADKILTTERVKTPPPHGNAGFRAIRSNGNHTLVLTEWGTVYGAGMNDQAQLGRPIPFKTTNVEQQGRRFVEFEELHQNVRLCAAAWQSSAYVLDVPYIPSSVRADRSPCNRSTIYTEGFGPHGELGRGYEKSTAEIKANPAIQEENQWLPVDFCGEFHYYVVDISAGQEHYVAVLSNGQVWGWGSARKGQLGDITPPALLEPTRISRKHIPFQAHRVVCGDKFTYVVADQESGLHTILGGDKYGLKKNMPNRVRGWKDIGATWGAIFVLFENGRLIGWGKERNWTLIPPNLPPIDRMAVGSDFILAVTKDQRLISWGWASHGNCGPFANLKPPVPPSGYITDRWVEITDIPGEIVTLGAGCSTSFVLTKVANSSAVKDDPIEFDLPAEEGIAQVVSVGDDKAKTKSGLEK
jgi:protein ATS1